MKTRVIISRTPSRLLNILRFNLIKHTHAVEAYVIDINDIFKAYDIIQPNHIYISNHDDNNKTIKAFIEDNSFIKSGCGLHRENESTNYIIDTLIYSNLNLLRNNCLAIMSCDPSDLPILESLDKHDIPYHIFDSPALVHKYNLGLLDDHQRSHIMNTYAGIATKNNYYVGEAQSCKCHFYDLLSISNIIEKQPYTLTTPIIDINQYIKDTIYDKS